MKNTKNNWGLEFHLEIDKDQIDAETVKQFIERSLLKSGLGDWRPKRGDMIRNDQNGKTIK